MKTAARSISFAPVALAVSLLAAFLVLFAPLSASAHDTLVSSSPAADSTVETLPAEITLTFSDKLITGEGATELLVTDASGTSVVNGPATVNGAIVTQPLAAQAAAGAYHVVWKIVSSDGHPTSGEFSFTVTTDTLATAEPSTAPTATPAQTPDAPVSTAPETTEDSGDAVGFWVLGIVGALVVAAVVILLLSRRGNRSSAGSDDQSSR
ncbi:copper resistance CopC family protein [Microbacterium hydrocarbonoxydans]|uniref:copper resistance CopC family protein n=1 Tax=Microbacterium hydrocarbonoxydans TaxID=273678 RepID=UPI003D998215